MIVAIITDIHLTPDGSNPQGLPVWDNFFWALSDARKNDAEMLILTGDLCYDVGNADTIQKVKNILVDSGIEHYAIPGNHDDPKMLCDVFGYEMKDKRMKPFSIKKKNATWYFLDSSDYTLCMEDLMFVLNDNTESMKLTCIHHPLCKGASLFMDTHHALKNYDDVYSILLKTNQPVSFFHGHYHIESQLNLNDFNFYLTPSTFYQIDGQSAHHVVSSVRPAYRLVNIGDKNLHTCIIAQ
ncbi:MAG: metallophosphoesterase [Cytophagaceae bacterium]|nr:metallophosphoesterase [Cytophagaceae bacterium]MDW8455461.1 metallophosphoesterase [Cytophagaceae bacterium]